MATLKIRKSENEVIELPLTTEKPIARSLAVFYNGQIYYCPLVYQGLSLDSPASIDSGIKVRCGSFIYGLATDIYDPVTYADNGDIWISDGRPAVHKRGYLELDGSSYLTCYRTFSLTKASSFSFYCSITPTALRGITQCIFVMYVTTSTFISLFINASNKLSLSVNSSAVKTSSEALTESKTYYVGVSYNDGQLTATWNNVGNSGTVSKNITAGTYTARIGANASYENAFIGKIRNVNFNVGSASSRILFGD